MKKTEYIDSVTKSIANIQKKAMVKAELDDHIIQGSEFFENIGYDAETAQEKSIEAMGDFEPVSEQFGKIHNKSTASDILKDIALSACIFIFSAFLMPIINTVYDTKTTACYVILKGSLILLLLYILSLNALKNNRRDLIDFSFILMASWIYMSASALMLSSEYDDARIEALKNILAVLLIILFNLPILSNILYARIYKSKLKRLSNTGKDLRRKNRLIRFSKTVICVLIFTTAVSLIVYAYLINTTADKMQEELSSSINTVLNLQEKTGSNKCDIEQMLKNENVEYKKQDRGEDNIEYNIAPSNEYISASVYNEDDNIIMYIFPYDTNCYCVFGLFFKLAYIKADREYALDILSINTKEFVNSSKSEIIDTLISYNPASVSLQQTINGSIYTFSYEVNFETYISTIEFDNNNKIVSAQVELESF